MQLRSSVRQCDALCYVPSPRGAENGWCGRAPSCRRCPWSQNGSYGGEEVTVDGRPLDPRDMVYSSHALLVCDGRNVRIVVMDPQSGKVRETVQFDRRNVGEIVDLCLCGDHAMMLHDQTGSSINISFLDIK